MKRFEMQAYDYRKGKGRLPYGFWWDSGFYSLVVDIPLKSEISSLVDRMVGVEKICIPGMGSGTDASFWLARKETSQVVGFDLSVLSLRITRARYHSKERLDLIVADADSPPFRSNSFDAVFCSATLHHMRDVVGVLVNLRRLTRDKGYLIMIEPGVLNPLFALARKILPSNIHTIGERPFVYGNLRKSIALSGWRVQTISYYVLLNTVLLTASKVLKLRIASFGIAASKVDSVLSRSFLRELFWFACIMGSAEGHGDQV